jgi:CDP-Glycerol:Poly(glycerophosphate) glycerophosphotransferase
MAFQAERLGHGQGTGKNWVWQVCQDMMDCLPEEREVHKKGQRNRDIWFVPGNSNHMAKFAPLMSELRRDGCSVHVLCIDAIQPSTHSAAPSIESMDFPVKRLPPCKYEPHEHWLIQAFNRRHVMDNIRKTLSGHHIDAVVLGGDNGLGMRAVVHVAKRMEIPTILIPDGLVLPIKPLSKRNIKLSTRIKWRIKKYILHRLHVRGERGTSGVDLIMPMNKTGRKCFIDLGIDADGVIAVGSPEYDRLAQDLKSDGPTSEGESLRSGLGLEKDRPVVLFAHHMVGIDREATRKLILDMAYAARQCGATLLVKFHPRQGEDMDEWRQWAHGKNMDKRDILFIKRECSSIQAVKKSDVVITIFSTVSLEALALHKPLIVIQYLNVSVSLPYGRLYGAALDAQSPGELKKAIISLVTDEGARKEILSKVAPALDQELFGLDGRSVERMISHIYKLIDRKSRTRVRAQQ